jgi:hypothetical protein
MSSSRKQSQKDYRGEDSRLNSPNGEPNPDGPPNNPDPPTPILQSDDGELIDEDLQPQASQTHTAATDR